MQKVVITGASGEIGSILLRHIDKERYSVCALPSGADIRTPDTYASCLQGAYAVIHAAGITHTNAIKNYYNVNSYGTLQLLRASKSCGVRRFIFLSTRAISKEGGGYSRSKMIAEKYVRESGMDWLVLRLGEVYGYGGKTGIDALLGSIGRLPFVPVAGRGENTMMPVYIDDAVYSVVQALERGHLKSKVYTIAGPEELTYNELVDKLLSARSMRRFKLHIPLLVLKTAAYTASLFIRNPALVKDQLPRLACKKESDISAAAMDLGFSPRRITEAVKTDCTVCGREAELLDGRLRLFRCRHCTHTFTVVSAIDPQLYGEEYFRQRHKNWFKYQDYSLFRFFHKVIRRNFGRRKIKLLDAGCGKGDFLKFIGRSDPDIERYGIDLTENASAEFHFIQGDIFKSEVGLRFDAVCVNAMVEHVADPRMLTEKIKNMLLPGGILIVSTVNNQSLIYRSARFLNLLGVRGPYNQLYGEHHLQHYTRRSLRSVLEAGGFQLLLQKNYNYPFRAVDLLEPRPWLRRFYFSGVWLIFLLQALSGSGIAQVAVCKKAA